MKDIIQLLLIRLGIIPGLKSVKLYNNQLENQAKEDLASYPMVLLELLNVDYEPFNGGSDIQYGTAEVKVHVISDNIAQGTDLGIYELKHLIHQYLHRYDGDLFNPLVRTSETLDTNHSNLYDYQISYTFRFAEETRPLPQGDDGIFPFDYTLSGDL